MSSLLLLAHSYLRWLVLLAGLAALVRLITSYRRAAPFTPADQRAARIFIGLFDLQFLIGLILYFASPMMRDAMKNMAASMQDPHTRFFVAEHPMMMFIALCIAHGASIWARKTPSDRVKFLRLSVGFALALGLIIAGIPWWRLGVS